MQRTSTLPTIILLLTVLCCGGVSCSREAGKPPQPAAVAGAPRPATPAAPGRRAQLLATEFRALYITSWTAGTGRFQELLDLVARSRLNALVIDIKDSTGRVGYPSRVPLALATGACEKRIRDLEGVLKRCREKNVHTVARIAVFQDPHLAASRPDLAVRAGGTGVWKDRKGLAWVDPASREVWDYNLAIAREAAGMGFDEVQFDYVRFPTDGRLAVMTYPVYRKQVPKHEVIRDFFRYVDEQMRPVDVLTSADLFGLTTMVEDDMNIGQRIEDVADHVDFICPMVYPSHYPRGHLGLANPAEHPYRVIYDASVRGLQRIKGKRARLRPWLQDFKLGAVYDRTMVREQIRAARDAGVTGFAMWNARNVYTEDAYLEPFPEPDPAPPLKATLLAELSKREAARAAFTSRSSTAGRTPSPAAR